MTTNRESSDTGAANPQRAKLGAARLGNSKSDSSKSGSNQSSSTYSGNWLPKLIVAVLFGIFVVSIYISSTSVSGVEFNPVTWQVRYFSFRADPFTDFQWSGIYYDTRFGKTDVSITKLLDFQSAEDSNRWEPALIERISSSQSGPSMAMVQLLTGYGLKRGHLAVDYWKNWTADHPAKAKEFWPAIQRLAIHGNYRDIPTFLELPQLESDDHRFLERLDQMMQESMLPGKQPSNS